MNLILLDPTDFVLKEHDGAHIKGRVVLRDHRFQHCKEVLKCQPNETLTVGLKNGPVGVGRVSFIDASHLELDVSLSHNPPEPLPVTLVLALPRPKMLKRILQHATTMGVKQLYLINSWKVEKSFWASPWLTPEKVTQNCELGLEQAKDTILPEVYLRKRFKPFVEDELPQLLTEAGNQGYVAHPGSTAPCPTGLTKNCLLAIGPEGGFTAYEVEMLNRVGLQSIHLGPRILRVETAVPALLAKLFA